VLEGMSAWFEERKDVSGTKGGRVDGNGETTGKEKGGVGS
jgi:hypothetical protein